MGGWPRPVGFGTAGLPRALRARGTSGRTARDAQLPPTAITLRPSKFICISRAPPARSRTSLTVASWLLRDITRSCRLYWGGFPRGSRGPRHRSRLRTTPRGATRATGQAPTSGASTRTRAARRRSASALGVFFLAKLGRDPAANLSVVQTLPALLVQTVVRQCLGNPCLDGATGLGSPAVGALES